MDKSAVWQGMEKRGRGRRKRSLSDHQKQMRFLTVMVIALTLAVFTGVIFWCNL